MSEPITRIKAPTRLDYLVSASTITARFLDGILEKRLEGRRCPSCQKVYVPPRGACPTCAEPLDEAVPVGPNGTVTTFSIIRIPFEGQVLTPPYACAHVLLDSADVPLLHIVGGCEVEAVRIGMRVGPVWAEEITPTLASIRYYHPVDEPDVPDRDIQEYL
ncbi:MAG: putative OB-fold protein [Myxococcota bacterium]|jgi:uncharacterized OB-fold protein